MLLNSEGTSHALVLPGQFQQSQVSFTNVLRCLLFQVCAQHQTCIKKSKAHPSFRTWLLLLFLPVQTAQLLSLVLQLLKDLQDYETYAVIEQALLIVRPDRWLEGLGTAVCLGVAAVLVWLATLLGLQLCLVQSSKEASLHPALLLAFSLPLAALHKYLWLPLLSLLFQNAAIVLEKESEYMWMGVTSVAEIVLLAAFLLLYLCFLHEDAWSLRSEQPTAHADSHYEVRELAVLCSFCALPLLLSAHFSLMLYASLAGYLCGSVLWCLPYYSSIVLLGKCWQYGLVCWAAVCGLIGVGTDSMTVTIKLFLFVAPCILLLLSHLLSRRKGLISFRKAKPTLWKYELMVRVLLEANTDPADTVLAEAIEYGTRQFAQKERRFFLLVGQYYYYVRGLPEIALIRLSQGKLCPPDFLAEFQIYRFSEALYRVSRSEEREFVEYERRYQSCQQQDCALCEETFDLLSSVLNKSTTGPLLERALLHLARLITGTNLAYRQLKQRFPTDPFVLESYGSYLSDLFHESEALDLKTRGIVERNRRKKAHINVIESYSSEDTGVMIVSCQKELFGKVVFANGQMSGVLGGNIQDIVGKDLDDFIPPPYNLNHNLKLQSFLHHGEAKEISRSHLFLTSLTGFSVEVTFRFRPTVVAGVPYFLVAARQKPKTREFAVYGEDGKVTSHSQGFPGKLGLGRKWIMGDSIETLFPGIRERIELDESPFPYTYSTSKDTLWLKFSSIGLGHSFIHCLYLFTSSQGVEDLFHSSTGLGYSRFRRSLRATPSSDNLETSVDLLKSIETGKLAESEGTGKDIGLRETRDEATGVTSTSTSYGRSQAGLGVRRKAIRAGRTLKLASLGLIVLMTVLLAIVLGVLWATFQALTPNSTTETGAIRLHFLKIAHITRRLDLISHGYEPLSVRSSLQQALEAEVSSLSAGISLLDSGLSVPVVTRIDGKVSYLHVPLKTALTDYNTHARLQGGGERGDAGDVFYTYYNGVGPLLKEVNRTVEEGGDAERSKGLQIIGLTVGITVPFMALGILTACILILKSLFTLQTCYSRLWQIIITLPVSKARDIMNTHKNRIEVIHGVEHVAPELGKIRENRSMATPPVRWTLLIGKCLFLVLCSAAFTIFLGAYGYREVQRLLWVNMRYINTVSYLTVLPTLTLHTLKELSLWQEASPISYPSLVPEAQSIPSLSLLLSTHLSSLSSLQLSVLQDLDSMATQAKAIELDLAFSSACPHLNESRCEGSLLDRGEMYGVAEWGLEVVDLQRRVEEGENVWEQLVALETSMEMLTDATVALQRNMQKYAETSNTQFTSDMLTYACIYLLCSSLVYLLVALPLVEGLKKKCVAAWKVTTLVRNDYVAR